MKLYLLGGVALEAAGRRIGPVLRQPKRLALLLYLTIAPPRGYHRRDKLLAMFWPDLDDARARHSLRQAIYVLRQALPADVLQVRGTDEVRIASNRVWCDVFAAERAFSDANYADVCELYRGDFMDGLHISDVSTDFEYWISAERERVRELALTAAMRLARDAARAGDGQTAAHWTRRAAVISPFDEMVVQELISVLDRVGDRSGAIQSYRQFAARLRLELDAEPSPETRALIESIRGRATAEPLDLSGRIWPARAAEAGGSGPTGPPPPHNQPNRMPDDTPPDSGSTSRAGPSTPPRSHPEPSGWKRPVGPSSWRWSPS